MRRCELLAGVGLWVLCMSGSARAANHLWDISEIFSNSSGTVQFIELHDDFSFEGFFNGLQLLSSNSAATQTNTFTFPADLPDPINTSNKYVLIATAGFTAAPGSVTPDYILTMPSNFLFTGGGSITYTGSFDSISYASMPTDGTMSLTRNLTTHVVTTAVNSPTNFTGASGSVPEPAVGGALLLVATLIGRRRNPALQE